MRGPGVHVPTDAAEAWTPGPDQIRNSRLLQAMSRWQIEDLADLHRRSVDDPEWFWRVATHDLDVDFDVSFERVVDESRGKPLPEWFTGGRLDLAWLCADRHAGGPAAAKDAVVFEGDDGRRRSLTYAELAREVRSFAAQLIHHGVQPGDRVLFYLPVVPEAVVAFLACAAIGAVSVLTYTGYGVDALATRLRDSGATVVITADGTTRRGKPVALKTTLDQAVTAAPEVRHVFVVRHLDNDVPMVPGRDHYWDELDSLPAAPRRSAGANDPLMIIYTSGTTGAPKGIVHSHAGFAVKTATDFGYGFDVRGDDVIGWISDLGWLVGPMMIVGGLQLGATIVLIEGVPQHPTPQRLWDVVARNQVTLQGIAPTAARAIMAAGGLPPGGLPSLRAFASTGEAWDEPTWHWLLDEVGGGRRPIINFSGGTEVGGGLLVAYPFLPMSAGGFNAPLPGLDVGVVDGTGDPVTAETGELVVFNTWPGMTHAFWEGTERYLETYWSRWKDVWLHGDLATVDGSGRWAVIGRSDDTIKVSGRRIGPSEVESALLRDERVAEVAVIGVPDEKRGQRIVAFLVVRGEQDQDDVVATAHANVGRAFAPSVHVVPGLPKTRNGKIMRRLIGARYTGTPLGDLSSLDPATPAENIPEGGATS